MANQPRSLRYTPRDIFLPYHGRSQRWAVMVAHRRAGKTVATLADVCHRALFCPLHRPQYAYIAPQYNQAKKIAWNYLKDITKEVITKQPSESNLSVELYTGATVTLFGADNPDSFRGLYFDGAILDEYGSMAPSIWGTVLRPTLLDRHGWATFIGTPNGPNHFRDQWVKALKSPLRYFTKMLPYTETNLIPQSEIEDMKEDMTEEEFAQEMLCSFEAATRGAFYGKEVTAAENDGRVRDFPIDDSDLHFVFDLGFRDDTVIIAWQNRPEGPAVCHAEAANGRPISYYIGRVNEICSQLKAPRGRVWLPHDARAKSLQTGRSIVEQFVAAGIKPEIVPNLDLQDGISAGRLLFQHTTFHRTNTEDLILALKSYHREFDEEKKMYKDSPVHDWSSHYADGYRYMSLVAQRPVKKAQRPAEQVQPIRPMAPTLDQLWASRKSGSNPHRRV